MYQVPEELRNRVLQKKDFMELAPELEQVSNTALPIQLFRTFLYNLPVELYVPVVYNIYISITVERSSSELK